jgi:Putative prokaryotic signal transducing protein
MWRCPKCQSKVDDSFEVCWSCGTTPEGEEDPTFMTADEQAPIEDSPAAIDGPFEDPLADFAGTPMPELVECYRASNTVEAKFVADRLMEQGIPALADHHDVSSFVWGSKVWGCGPKIRVRPEDVARAQSWLKGYEERRKSQQ